MKHIDLSLSSIVKGIITEKALNYFDSTYTKINDAIDNMNYITLNYDDGQGDEGIRNPAWGNPRDRREVIPYCLGVKNGRLILRPYHTSPNHTKRGPYEWKFMYLDNMKNVRVSKKHFTMADIPANANKTGDTLMDEVINIVGMNASDREEKARMRDKNGEFITPLTRVKQTPQNEPGAINKPKTKNINSLANLNYTPGKYDNGMSKPDYKAAQKNMRDFNANYSETERQQKFADWNKAEAEAQQQNRLNTPGPVIQRQQQQPQRPQRTNVNNNEDEEEEWDEYLNNPNNNNF